MPLAWPLLTEVLIPLVAAAMAALGATWLAKILNGLNVQLPAIGRPFDGVIAAIRQRVENALNDAFNAVADAVVVPVLRGTASAIHELGLGVLHMAAATYNALDHLTHVSVHAIIKAFIAPLQADLSHLKSATVASLRDGFSFIGVLADRIAAQAVRIDHLAQDVIPGLRTEVFKGIDHLRDVAIPNTLQGAKDFTLGEIGAVEGDIGRVEGKVNGLLGGVGSLPVDKLLSLLRYLPYVGALAGALSLEAARTAERCAPKTRLLCETDQALWDSLLGDALPLLALADLLLIVRLAQETAAEAAPAVRELLEL